MTTRRTIFAGIAAALLPGHLAAQEPTQGGMRRLGVLMTTLASDPAGQARAAAFVQGLGALGWKEGGNLRIDWRWGRRRPFAVRALRG
jgi:putative tryptophan/tyrosine transport system substrate-binding protein